MPNSLDIAQRMLGDALSDAHLTVYRAQRNLERAQMRLEAAQNTMNNFLKLKYPPQDSPEVQKPEAKVNDIQQGA